MRLCRANLPDRCYHLISRVAHSAFFLDEEERTRLVDLIRRAARFSGARLLAYSVMSNHFHVFVYIGRPESLSDAEIVRRISALYSDARFGQVMKKWNEFAKKPGSPSFRRYRESFLRRSAHDAWHGESRVFHEGASPSANGGGADRTRRSRPSALAAAEICPCQGGQEADRTGRAAMTRKSYCGDLLWQSCLTLFHAARLRARSAAAVSRP